MPARASRRPPPGPALAGAPTAAGLVLCRPLAADGPGPPWRARDARSGHEVVLHEPAIDASAPLGARDLVSRIEPLPRHPHLLVPVVHEDVSGRLLLATRHMARGGLDQAMAGRRGLGAGEVATVAVAVGRALAALHAAGVVHGCVKASAVLVDAHGRVFLDATPAVARPAREGVVAGDDVVALSRLLRDASEPGAPRALAQVLHAGASGDGVACAEELVARLVAVAAPEPLEGPAVSGGRSPAVRPSGRPVGRPIGRTLRRSRGPHLRRGLVRALGAAAVVAAAAFGVAHIRDQSAPGLPPGPAGGGSVSRGGPGLWATSATSTPSPTASPTATVALAAVDWVAVLTDLDSRRAEAFATGDPAALIEVDVAGSAALAADRASLAQLCARGLVARGFQMQITSVTAVTVTARRAVLRVVDSRPAYQLVQRTGGIVVASWPGRRPAVWKVELVLGAVGWQVANVRGW